jgi:GDP-L-fucose synthase
MPTNLYGLGDNYHPENSHVIPALIRRFHEAKVNRASEVIIWGTGTPRRDFLYVDDLAKACVFVMGLSKTQYAQVTSPMQSHLNVGFGHDVTIAQLATAIAKVIGYTGTIKFDAAKPDGAPRKWMSSERLQQLGWSAHVDLEEGLQYAYDEFCKTRSEGTMSAR